MEPLLYAEAAYAVLGAIFEVYRGMGSGFWEPVYQERLETEFNRGNPPYLPQRELKLTGRTLAPLNAAEPQPNRS